MEKTVKKHVQIYRINKGRKRWSIRSIFCLMLIFFTTVSIISCGRQKSTATVVKTTAPTIKVTPKDSAVPKTTSKGTATQQKTGSEEPGNESAGNENTENGTEGSIYDNLLDNNGDNAAEIKEYTYDFGGRTIMIAKNGFPGSPVEYPAIQVAGNLKKYVYGTDAVTDKIYDNARKTEQLLNCKLIENAPGNNVFTQYRPQLEAEILSGTCQYSAIPLQRGWYVSDWADNKLIVPINDYIDVENDSRYNQGIVAKEGSYKGKFYGIPWISLGWPALQGISYNLDILGREALPDPVEMGIEGNWNWETLTDIAMKATRDLNGDGITDQYGICIRYLPTLVQEIVHNNAGILLSNINGKYTYNLTDKAVLEALNFVSDLHNIYKAVSPNVTDYAKGTALMFIGTVTTASIYLNPAIPNQRFVKLPVGPSNTNGKTVPVLGNWMWVIPVTERDPKGIAILSTYLNRTMYDPNPIVAPEVRREATYTQLFGADERQKEYLRKESLNYDPVLFDNFTQVIGDFSNFVNSTIGTEIIKNNVSVTQFVEANMLKFQAEIDKYMNK